MGGRGGGGVGRRWPPVVEREPEGAERSGRDFFLGQNLQPELFLCKQLVQADCARGRSSSEQLSEVSFIRERVRSK